jgi:hypothetical protein
MYCAQRESKTHQNVEVPSSDSQSDAQSDALTVEIPAELVSLVVAWPTMSREGRAEILSSVGRVLGL